MEQNSKKKAMYKRLKKKKKGFADPTEFLKEKTSSLVFFFLSMRISNDLLICKENKSYSIYSSNSSNVPKI